MIIFNEQSGGVDAFNDKQCRVGRGIGLHAFRVHATKLHQAFCRAYSGRACGTPALADIPPLVTTLPELPPPKPQQYTPLYTIVVDNVPVKELLFSLARDTKYNIDINPGIVGTVTLNAVNESLPAILERVAR